MSATMPESETPRDAARRLAAPALREGYRPAALHEYTSADGSPVFWRIRCERDDGRKWIRPMRANGDGYTLGEPDFSAGKPLYQLHRLHAEPDAPVLVAEGETCVEALERLGVVATTSGAADSAGRADWSPLHGRRVTVWPDHDDAGARYAAEVIERLRALGCAVELIDVDRLELPEHGDAVDWLAAHPGAAAADVDALPRAALPRPVPAAVRPAGPSWPEPLADEAFHGLAGDVVRTLAPHTEADPVALLVQFLAASGSCVGCRPYYLVEGDRHHANLYAVLVGETAKGRKGTSWGRIRALFERLDDPWARERVHSGLSSGEGLIWAVRDPIEGRERTGKGADARYITIEIDPGISDKRLCVVESEFANVLRVMAREGNTLSRVMRDAWDRGDLATMTKNNAARATGAHISIIGHVTADELRRYLDRTESANGFANRFVYLCVRRTNVLPFGGEVPEDDLQRLARRLGEAIGTARRIERVTMGDDARAIWARVYPDLSDGQPGLLGAIIGRAEAQVIRIALVYALLDGATEIGAPHLLAALALWQHAEASARHVFGAALGDPVADEIARALADGPKTRTELRDLFGRHRSGAQIGRALALLEQQGRVQSERVETDGRPAEQWRLVAQR